MGALAEGFEIAQRKHEAELAEARARDQLIEDRLRDLGRLLDEDAAFLREQGMTHTMRAHTLHIDQKRIPLITAHFDPTARIFQLTFMKDGSHATVGTPEEAAKAIGGFVYESQRQR